MAVGVATLGLVADAWVSAVPLVAPPSDLNLVPRAAGAVLELPLGQPNDDLEAMFRQIRHGRAVVNGFSGYTPPHYAVLTQGLNRQEDEVLSLMGRLGVTDVFVIRERDLDGRYDRFLAAHRDTRLVSKTSERAHYRLESDQRSPAAVVPGEPLEIAGLLSSANAEAVENVADGQLRSRWHSGTPSGTDRVLVDLGVSRTIHGVRLALGPFVVDSPRSLQIEISADLATWRILWDGPTTARVIEAAIRQPLRVEMDFLCPRCEGRYVRVRGEGRDPTAVWSIAELSILGSP